MKANRIRTLDGFRFLSITLVVLFHYMSSWTYPAFDGNFYPYNNLFAEVPLVRSGGIGVQFFFMISGFVIFFTLNRTRNFKEFLVRRWIRLWPTMLLCSVLTFLVVKWLDPQHTIETFEVGYKNFLPGLTFTPISLWNTRFMDSAYWTLEVEVKFYLWAGVTFFFFRKHFVAIWTTATFVIFLLHHFTALGSSGLFAYLFFPSFMMFFTAGILLYTLFDETKSFYTIAALVFLYLIGLTTRKPVEDKLFITAFFVLFYIFIYKAHWLNFLNNKIVQAIGVASYPLYLFHQHAGVLWIREMASYFPLQGSWQIIYPIIVYVTMCFLSYLIFKHFEIPVKNRFMGLLKKSQRRSTGSAASGNPLLVMKPVKRSKQYEH